MCLGIPMKIVSIDGYNAHCSAKGLEREVSLFLLQGESLGVGDYVMVHIGYAQQKVSEQDAHEAWALYDELIARMESQE